MDFWTFVDFLREEPPLEDLRDPLEDPRREPFDASRFEGIKVSKSGE